MQNNNFKHTKNFIFQFDSFEHSLIRLITSVTLFGKFLPLWAIFWVYLALVNILITKY